MAAAASTQPPQPPKLPQLLERDPYLAPFEKDFQRRYRPACRRPRPPPRGGEGRLGRARGGGRAGGDRPPASGGAGAGGGSGGAGGVPSPLPPPSSPWWRGLSLSRLRGGSASRPGGGGEEGGGPDPELGASQRPFRRRRLHRGRSCRRGPAGPPEPSMARRCREASSAGLVASVVGGRPVRRSLAGGFRRLRCPPWARLKLASLRYGGVGGVGGWFTGEPGPWSAGRCAAGGSAVGSL